MSFWTIFYPFTLLKFQKIKILNKLKKCLEISSFYTNAPKIMIICHTVSEIQCVIDVIIFYFGLFFAILPPPPPLSSPPPINPKNENLKKMKKHLQIPSVYTCVPKIMITWCTIPGIWCMTDRQTDGQAEMGVEVT